MKKTKKSIRIIIGSLSVGGAERHLSYILPELSKKGWEIKILTMTSKSLGDLSHKLETNGIKVHSHPKYCNFAILPKYIRIAFFHLSVLFRLWYDFVIDRKSITHFFLPHAYVFGAVAAKLALVKAPLIMSRRSQNAYQNKRPRLKWFELHLHRYCHVILGNSLKVVGQLYTDENVNIEKLRLIYNGIPIKPLDRNVFPSDCLRSELSISSTSYLIVIVANLLPYKGHKDLLFSLSSIHGERFSDWHLAIIGRDDGLKSELEVEAKLLGFSEKISFLGLRNDVELILHEANLAVLTSHEEGFSNAVLEYMACGLPCVVTDVGGNAEAIIDNECGLVVPAKSPDKLGKAILWMYQHPEKAKEFGIKAKARVKKHFSMDACVDQYDQVYSALLEGKEPAMSPSLLNDLKAIEQ